MNILLIGSGGRENALAYKLAGSPSLKKLFTAPGNPGTAKYGENVSIDIEDHKEIISFCKKNEIDLVVVGPEKPLVEGLADSLRKENIKVFGPNMRAAEIEASKSFAKALLKKHNIPTADFEEFTLEEINEAKKYLSLSQLPVVIKADGLAAGKGVMICESLSEAAAALNEFFVEKSFGDSGNKIIIEEFMKGEEASIFVITDGKKFISLPSAQDYKRIGDNDTGKNTGGMGAYSPAPLITDDLLQEIEQTIVEPVLTALREEGRKFNGCLYCGVMITDEGPKVVEFNCRFGDPETQAVLPLIDGDFAQFLYSAAGENLNSELISYNRGCAVCVVAASKGYPDNFTKGFEITGLNGKTKEGILIFHAGTKEVDGKLFSNGGRVLNVVAFLSENNLSKAKENAYSALSEINFENIYYRKDIASKGIK
jgi:phosphoribosylamine---glycine ligase